MSIMSFIVSGLRLVTLLVVFVSSAIVDPTTDQYFYSTNVPQATGKFTAACSNVNGVMETINHPMVGAQGEQLQAVVCTVGDPSARSIVFTISGTHGVEGYPGSMAQISMLRGPPSMFPRGVRMVHLHMVNPYGASFTLKENEDNADQLKNAAGYYALNYSNPIVEGFMDNINLSSMGSSAAQANAQQVFGKLINDYGLDKVNLALKTGQGSRREGIAYFGSRKSWSSNTTEYVVRKYLQNAGDILVIDWHSAVGPYGEWSFVPVDQEADNAMKKWAPSVPRVPYDVGVPTGGQLPYSYIKAMTNATRVVRGLWEAGTEEVTSDINNAFILRLYCRFYSNTSDPFCGQITWMIRNFFYPYAANWTNITYQNINRYLPQVLNGFAADVVSEAVPLGPTLIALVGLVACLLTHVQ